MAALAPRRAQAPPAPPSAAAARRAGLCVRQVLRRTVVDPAAAGAGAHLDARLAAPRQRARAIRRRRRVVAHGEAERGVDEAEEEGELRSQAAAALKIAAGGRSRRASAAQPSRSSRCDSWIESAGRRRARPRACLRRCQGGGPTRSGRHRGRHRGGSVGSAAAAGSAAAGRRRRRAAEAEAAQRRAGAALLLAGGSRARRPGDAMGRANKDDGAPPVPLPAGAHA